MTNWPPVNSGIYAEFDGTADVARRARALIRDVLGDDHPCAADVALIVTELISNAVAHSRSGQPGGALVLAIQTSSASSDVHVQVRDIGSPRSSATRDAGIAGEHGRGLVIVAELALTWGTQRTTRGRTTWALIGDRQACPRTDRIAEREGC